MIPKLHCKIFFVSFFFFSFLLFFFWFILYLSAHDVFCFASRLHGARFCFCRDLCTFPRKPDLRFQMPISCLWTSQAGHFKIDNSSLKIIVYFWEMYTGLIFYFAYTCGWHPLMDIPQVAAWTSCPRLETNLEQMFPVRMLVLTQWSTSWTKCFVHQAFSAAAMSFEVSSKAISCVLLWEHWDPQVIQVSPSTNQTSCQKGLLLALICNFVLCISKNEQQSPK